MELTPGEGILVNIGDQHEDWRGDGAKFIGFSFTLEAFPATNGIPALLAPGVSPQEQRFRIDLKEAEGLARKIYEEEQRQTAFSRLIQEAISLELFWRIIQGFPGNHFRPVFWIIQQTAVSGPGFPDCSRIILKKF